MPPLLFPDASCASNSSDTPIERCIRGLLCDLRPARLSDHCLSVMQRNEQQRAVLHGHLDTLADERGYAEALWCASFVLQDDGGSGKEEAHGGGVLKTSHNLATQVVDEIMCPMFNYQGHTTYQSYFTTKRGCARNESAEEPLAKRCDHAAAVAAPRNGSLPCSPTRAWCGCNPDNVVCDLLLPAPLALSVSRSPPRCGRAQTLSISPTCRPSPRAAPCASSSTPSASSSSIDRLARLADSGSPPTIMLRTTACLSSH
jgi:hypothetical protein